MKRAALLGFIVLLLTTVAANAVELFNVFPDEWLQAVVSIEQAAGKESRPLGTGFLAFTGKHLVLVTAAHVVFSEDGKLFPDLQYRVASLNGTELITNSSIAAAGGGGWFRSSAADVAIRFFGITATASLKGIPLEFFLSSSDLKAGNPCVVLGFPAGYRSALYPHPVLRQGVIARADPEDLLLDAFVFPGNSGGPAIYLPPFNISGGLLKVTWLQRAALIGVVVEALSYSETAISSATKHPRVVFEDNMGLARIVPAEQVIQLIHRSDVTEFEKALP